MNTIVIKEFHPGMEVPVSRLIRKVYDEFVAPDYLPEGNSFFYEWIDPAKIKERQNTQNNILIAFSDKEMAGMIEIRENKYISLLFVDKEFHNLGIAKKLFQHSLKTCIQRDPLLNKFYVHASPYSIPFYQKIGFTATDEMHVQNGIKYLPMEMVL